MDLIVTVASDLIVSSNGLLLSDIDNGDGTRTFHWQENYPISTYLVSVAITNYEHHRDWYVNATNDSLPIDYYVYPAVADQAHTTF